MTQQTLAQVWYFLLVFVWGTYLTLEGYVTGTGMLFPFLAKRNIEEYQLKKSIGPFWDSDQVWLIGAGGLTFATFPKTYAVLLSSFYSVFFLLLFALIFRGPGIEFMDKLMSYSWKKKWIWILCITSFLIPFLIGLTFSTIFSGLPIDEKGLHLGFFDLVNGYSLLGGSTYTCLALLSGSLWIAYKTLGNVHIKAQSLAKIFWGISLLLVVTYFIVFIIFTNLSYSLEENPLLWSIPLFCVSALFLSILPMKKKKWLLSYSLVSLTIFTLFAAGFMGVYPEMLPSLIDSKYSITLYEASGSQLNLTIMLWITGIILPIVIGYKIWTYWLFREKITEQNADDYK